MYVLCRLLHNRALSASTRTYDEEEEDDLDETGLNTLDIDLLMTRVGVSRLVAVEYLKTQNRFSIFEELLKYRTLPRDTLLPYPANLSREELYYYTFNDEQVRRKPDYKDIDNLKKTIIDMIGN